MAVSIESFLRASVLSYVLENTGEYVKFFLSDSNKVIEIDNSTLFVFCKFLKLFMAQFNILHSKTISGLEEYIDVAIPFLNVSYLLIRVIANSVSSSLNVVAQ
jgi:hypothetical protein